MSKRIGDLLIAPTLDSDWEKHVLSLIDDAIEEPELFEERIDILLDFIVELANKYYIKGAKAGYALAVKESN